MRNKTGRCNHKKFRLASIFSGAKRGEDETEWFLLEADVSGGDGIVSRNLRGRQLKWRSWSIRILAVACLCVSVPLLARWAHDEVFYSNDEFVLKSLEFRTNGMLSAENLARVANVSTGANLMEVDLRAIRDRIEKLAVVEEAIVTRELPDKLRVDVKERTPVAWISCPPRGIRPGDKNRGFLIDGEGVIFRCLDVNEMVEALPIIEAFRMDEPEEGGVISAEGAESALQLIASASDLSGFEGMNIHSIHLRTEWSIECKYRNGINVTYARHEVERGLKSLMSILARSPDFGAPLASVNLAAKENIAVTFANSPDPASIQSFATPVKSEVQQPVDQKQKHLQSILKGG